MFQVVPSIDLRHGKVVRLQQGDYARQLDYDLDPLQTARSFAEAGAEWIHIVDLDGAKNGSVAQWELIRQIVKACGLKAQVGGGVRSTADVDRLIHEANVSRVVVGTKAIEDWAWFSQLATEPRMADKLVLAVDAKGGKVATRGWTQTNEVLAVELANKVRGWRLAGLLYTDVAKDGMLQGPNLEQTELLARATNVPVIASGGVGDIGDIRRLVKLPVWGVIVGRSLHDGRLDLSEAIRVSRGI